MHHYWAKTLRNKYHYSSSLKQQVIGKTEHIVASSIKKHISPPNRVNSILLYSKKHNDDFQARQDCFNIASPSPRKKARMDTPECSMD